MSELLNIAPLVDHAEIRGATVEIRGLDIEEIARLALAFPELVAMLGAGTFDAGKLLGSSNKLSAALVAASCRQIDAANAANLSFGEKADILDKAIRLTMPGGFGPLRDALVRLTKGIGDEAATREVQPISESQLRKQRRA